MSPHNDHLSFDTIARLWEGSLPEMEQCFAEDHLDECDDCRGVFERMDALLYRGFSAESHAAAIRRAAYASDPLVAALREAAGRMARDASAAVQRWLASAAAIWGSGSSPVYGSLGAVPVLGEEGAVPLRVVLEPGGTRAIVRIGELLREVEVEVTGGSLPELAILFAADVDFVPRVASFETVGGERSARFRRVPRGEYSLAVSPF